MNNTISPIPAQPRGAEHREDTSRHRRSLRQNALRAGCRSGRDSVRRRRWTGRSATRVPFSDATCRANLDQSSTYNGKNPLSINQLWLHDFDYGITLGDTYLFSANLVSSFRLGANRTNVVKIPDNYESWAGFGANVYPARREHDRGHGDRRVHRSAAGPHLPGRSIMDRCRRLSRT